MLLCGAAATETVDSSGEICRIDGMDISTLENGDGLANYEHLGASDGKTVGGEIVGKIVYAKKIFKLSECDSEEEKFFFHQCRNKPYLFIIVRLADGAGHPGAINLAAHIRDHVAHNEPIMLRWSIEGSTIKKEGNVIEESIARKVALTFTPCNKTATSSLIFDPNSPEGFNKVDRLDVVKNELSSNKHVITSVEMSCNPILGQQKLDKSEAVFKSILKLKVLLKAIEAGNADCAPSSLVGGAALQKEDIKKYKGSILAAVRDYQDPWDRKKFKEHLKKELSKAQLPEVSDQFLDHFTNIAETSRLKKSLKPQDPKVIKLLQKAMKLQDTLIELRTDLRKAIEGTQVELPSIYKVTINKEGKDHRAGRFMVFNNKLSHLEDYHNLLSHIPEGEVTPQTISFLGKLLQNNPVTIAAHKLDRTDTTKEAAKMNKEELTPNVKWTPPKEPVNWSEVKVAQEPTPSRAAIFSYFRPGMVKPHVVEFSPHGASLDGAALSHDELALMLENARNGIGQIKWHKGEGLLAKKEDEMNEDEALQHIRAAVAAGHIHPSVERALTKTLYEDPMVEGMGNKKAATQFRSQNRPGVYASIDANDFKHINDVHGHDAGDAAITSLGGALKHASAKVGTVKTFRAGGDEFFAYAPTHEDMAHFMHHAREHVNALPPINGVHKQSVSIGLGHNFETADKALNIAKQGKLDPVSKQRVYKPGQVPNLGHSLYPQHEGPLFQEATKPPKI